MISRRALLTLGLFGGAYWLSRNGDLRDRFGSLPEFSTEGVPNGFRRLRMSGDGVSAGLANPLLGLVDPNAPAHVAGFELTDANMDSVLFDVPGKDGRVRLAYFTDYNCPYCRVLGKELEALAAEPVRGLHISWHDMPLLGESSVLGARAAIAANEQDSYLPFHKRLNTGVVRINEAYIARIAEDLGLDDQRLMRDMRTAKTDLKLAQATAVGDAFGVIGTPFLLVERTAINGRVSMPLLRRIITLERLG